jgi:hypothetical protein
LRTTIFVLSTWNYAVFTTDKQQRAGVNQAECLACHKPLDKVSYTFTLKQLAEANSRHCARPRGCGRYGI